MIATTMGEFGLVGILKYGVYLILFYTLSIFLVRSLLLIFKHLFMLPLYMLIMTVSVDVRYGLIFPDLEAVLIILFYLLGFLPEILTSVLILMK